MTDRAAPPHPHWTRRLLAGRFAWLLLALVAFILLAGEAPAHPAERAESLVALIAILIATAYASRARRGARIATLLLNLLVLIGWLWTYLHPAPSSMYLGYAFFLAALLFSISLSLEFVLGSGSISPDHILGAICAYIMIGMAFATLYAIQYTADPTAFTGVKGLGGRPFAELFYFSFTTLSTVGYGDITPVSQGARSISMIEMLTGTFYVAVLIARLAGLYPPPEKRP